MPRTRGEKGKEGQQRTLIYGRNGRNRRERERNIEIGELKTYPISNDRSRWLFNNNRLPATDSFHQVYPNGHFSPRYSRVLDVLITGYPPLSNASLQYFSFFSFLFSFFVSRKVKSATPIRTLVFVDGHLEFYSSPVSSGYGSSQGSAQVATRPSLESDGDISQVTDDPEERHSGTEITI